MSNDEVISKLMILRDVRLFEKLSNEVLYVVASEASWREMVQDEILFSQGDEPDGLYIVASGEVQISSGAQALAVVSEYGFFGEVGLLNNTPRLATATVAQDGMLLVIDSMTFNDLTNDFPEVLRSITNVVIEYLQQMLALKSKGQMNDQSSS